MTVDVLFICRQFLILFANAANMPGFDYSERHRFSECSGRICAFSIKASTQENLSLSVCEQQVGSLISAFVIHFLESIFKLATGKISIF